MRSSYSENDVILLLKDITGLVEPQSLEEREKLIQSGSHYSEMLPIEYVPTEKYMKIYKESLERFSKSTALAVGNLADKIIQKKGKNVVLVSLARAGIPIGILLKRFIKAKYKIEVSHYSISIIRDRGIDKNAIKFLLKNHKAENLIFVDGWVGKGVILNELKKAVSEYENISSDIAVLADPANVTNFFGTREDILIPSSCLNCTISGLVSRTFLRDDIIGKDDFHGAIFYENLKNNDLSYNFISKIEENFIFDSKNDFQNETKDFDDFGIDEVKKIALEFSIDNINLIKPGIGETTRVLLRRIPWKILVDEKYFNSYELEPILKLAEEKNVIVEKYSLKHYKCCGLIKKMEDA